MAQNILQIIVEVSASGANSEVQKVNRGLSGIEQTAVNATRGASRGMSELERSAARAAVTIRQQFSNLGGLVQAALGVGLAGAAKSAVEISAGFEQARIGLQALIKEGENGQQLFDQIKAFALTSPFTFKDLLVGAQRLAAVGTEAKDIVPTLQKLSTAVSALSQGSGEMGERLNDIIRAFGDIRAAGKLTGEEFRQLKNTALPVSQILSEAFGKPPAEIKKAISEGLLGGEDTINALLDGIENRFRRFGEGVAGSLSTAFSNVVDSVQQSADEIVKPFHREIKQMISDLNANLKEIAEWTKNNKDGIKTWASRSVTGFEMLATGYAAYKIPAILGGIRSLAMGAIGGLSTLAGWLAIVGASLPLLAKFKTEYLDTEGYTEGWERLITQGPPKGVVKQGTIAWKREIEKENHQNAKDVGAALENLRKNLMIETNRQLMAGENQKSEERVKYQFQQKSDEEFAKKLKSAQSQVADILERAREKEADGLDRINLRYAAHNKELALTKQLTLDLAEAKRLEIATFEDELRLNLGKEEIDVRRESYKSRIKMAAEEMGARVQADDEMRDIERAAIQDRIGFEQEALDRSRTAQMRQADALNAVTLEQKLAVEQRKVEIEAEFATKSLALQQQRIQAELDADLYAIEKRRAALELTDAEYFQRKSALEEAAKLRGKNAEESTNEAIANARETAAVRQQSMVIDQNQRIFESLKQQAGGVFDALLTKANSIWEAIGNSLKTALLTAIKDVVTSRIAAMLMRMFTGMQVGFTTGGGSTGRGALARLGSLMGIAGVPVFAGGGSNFGNIAQIVGGPGGTSGFAGPVQMAGASMGSGGVASLLGMGLSVSQLQTVIGAGGTAATVGKSGALAKMGLSGAALSSLLFNSGSISLGAGAATTAAGIGGIGGTLAGLASSPAAGIAGGLLAYMGLKRGGKAGLAMSAGGGALAGAALGTFIFPGIGTAIGAAIGAAAGGISGLIRLFVKGAEQKAKEKIQALYGINMQDRGLLQQIVATAKSSFGGNLDMAIRSPQVREIIELYAMSTGQKMGGVTAAMQSVNLVQSGGAIRALPQYQNGSITSPFGVTLPNLSGGSAAQPVVIENVTLQVNGDSAAELLDGRVASVVNPQYVAAQALSATRSNTGRRDSTIAMLQPGLVTG